MAEKVTFMVLKVVDLQCLCCYKKIKKILCKFPQIRDQIYDVKANTVTIKVVSCDPKKIRDKLCCKGGKVIISIDIKEPPKPKVKSWVGEKPEEPKKPKEHPKDDIPKGVTVIVIERPKPSAQSSKAAPKPGPLKIPQPVSNPPVQPELITCQGLPPLYPVPTCCGECYGGYDGGQCRLGYGVPPQPQPCFDGYYGYRCGRGCGYGYGRDCRHFSRCHCYLSDENRSSCSIM